jgi:predicted ABC-type ATPase
VELAKERVKTRVREGGHNIPEEIIERRYNNGIRNLFNIYIPIVDEIMIFDNSNDRSEMIAEKVKGDELEVVDREKYIILKKYHEEIGKNGTTN